jgi:hypothetical protein
MIAVQLSGCSDLARWVRQYTYPQEFRYVERQDVRGPMRELAEHSRQLNDLLLQDPAPLEHRGEMIDHLRAMEQAAAKLDQSGWSTNHPKVDKSADVRRDLGWPGSDRTWPPNFLYRPAARVMRQLPWHK